MFFDPFATRIVSQVSAVMLFIKYAAFSALLKQHKIRQQNQHLSYLPLATML